MAQYKFHSNVRRCKYPHAALSTHKSVNCLATRVTTTAKTTTRETANEEAPFATLEHSERGRHRGELQHQDFTS